MAVDRLESSSQELALLRLLHLVLTGHVALAPDRTRRGRPAVRRRVRPAERSGLAADAMRRRGARRPRSAASSAGARAPGNPMSDRRMIEAAEIVSRAYEEIYAGAG